MAPDDASLASGATYLANAGRASTAELAMSSAVDHAADYLEFLTVDRAHYVAGQEIARGGMGRIIRARDRRLGRAVAIKELLHASSAARDRFEREARITARLQHPAIINILEAGSWSDGEPFFVMKLVTGDSLDKVIAARPALEARLGLLPNVIAAVDALAYAHSMRIIHRDLKPGNVLVGEFGETVVIDWGLAKDLASTSGVPDLPAGPYRLAPSTGQTMPGAIMGTPAYMPVEQAIGGSVDERADVYALGAMLYHVLAGVPPYAGRTTDETLAAVIAGPPPSLARRTTGVPPDLVTIVDKAMARSVDDRYPTAKELADDLKKFQTGHLVGAHRYSVRQLVRRWLRRHRTPIAITAVAMVMLAALGIGSLRRSIREQSRTEHQRRAAEQSRREAEELMSFMLGDLRRKLQPVGRLDVLDDVASKAVAYYSLKAQHLSDAELAKRALARRNLGDVLSARGRIDAALVEYRASLELNKVLAATTPSSTELAREVAIGHYTVGSTLSGQGDKAAALREYRASLAIYQSLVASVPGDARYRSALASVHTAIGDVVRAQGDRAGAMQAYRTAFSIRAALAAADPSSYDWQSDLAYSHASLGAMFLLGEPAAALREYQTALAIRQGLAAREPTNMLAQAALALGHQNVGDALLAQGDAARALVEYRVVEAIYTRLTAKDVENSWWQAGLAKSHLKVGDALWTQGDDAAARASYQAAMTITEAVAAKDPTNADRQLDLADSQVRIGKVLDPARGIPHYRVALHIYEGLVAKDPTNIDRQWNLAFTHGRIGAAWQAQGDAIEALAEYRREQAIVEALVARDPTNDFRQHALWGIHAKIGDLLGAQGGAAAAYRTSLTILGALAAKDPANATRQGDLVVLHEKLGDVLLAQEQLTEAAAEYEQGLTIARRIQAEHSESVELGKRIGILIRKVTTCAAGQGRMH